jgi:hypothetical protein
MAYFENKSPPIDQLDWGNSVISETKGEKFEN